MPCSPQILSGMLPAIHTIEKYDVLKPVSHSQKISVRTLFASIIGTGDELHKLGDELHKLTVASVQILTR